MEFIIKGGTIINAGESFVGDVYIKNGKIEEVGKNIERSGVEIVEAGGK